MEVPKKLKVFSGHMSRENMVQKDTCTPVITAALFAIAKTWKQPNVH